MYKDKEVKKNVKVIVASVFKFLLALQLLLARPASIKWILLATRNFHSPLKFTCVDYLMVIILFVPN
jgi:hypothetical protein